MAVKPRYCGGCALLLSEHARFCPTCGAAQDEFQTKAPAPDAERHADPVPAPTAPPQATPSQATPRHPNVAVVLITAVVCLAIGGAVAALMVSRREEASAGQLGFPVAATRNTTRVSGPDPVADAAGVASALFPSSSLETRPSAVVLLDKEDWQAAVSAAALVSAPMRAPILLTDGGSLPPATSETLRRLKPKGAGLARGAQAILVGDKLGSPSGLKAVRIRGSNPYSLAAAIDHFSAVSTGQPSADVVIASGEQAAYAMPAAAWAASSGDSVLFTRRDSLPAATVGALKQRDRPRIFLLGPQSAIGTGVENELQTIGKVKRIEGANPVDNAIAFARFKQGAFGWGAVVPGQNLTIANTSRPGDAAAAAGLATNGIFAPLVLTDNSDLPRTLESYLLDIQPGFEGGDPSQGLYDHVWILGAPDAISKDAQAQIDAAIALVPVN
jgi:putative cell wall-binding protein